MQPEELLKERQRFLIQVKPKRRATEILSYDEEEDLFVVAVKAPPVDGKANEEIERYFSRLLKREVRISSGHTSRKKLVVVE